MLDLSGKQQILVTAHLSDGRREDVTRQVVYESINRSVVDVDEGGLVRAHKTGETSVLVRAPGRAAAVRFGVIADPVPSYPETPENNFIDRHVFAKLKKFNIVPSELSSDAEFLRRVCLDLTGTLPPPNRVREFLASTDPDKRNRIIEVLLNSPEFEEFLFFRYGEIFRWYGGATQLGKDTQLYGEWLRQSIAINKPYDQLAVDRIAAQGYDGPSRFFYQLRFIIPAGGNDRRAGEDLPGPAAGLRPLPQPSLRGLEPGPVLGDGRLLRPDGGSAGFGHGRLPAGGRPRPRGPGWSIPGPRRWSSRASWMGGSCPKTSETICG